MRKILVSAVMLLLACAASVPVFAKYEPIEKAFEIRAMPDGTKILYAQGKPFKGTRIRMLAQVITILGQPGQKNLMLLNQEGTGGGLGKANNRFLLIQNTKTKHWQVIAESYQLGGTIIGALDPGSDLPDVEVFLPSNDPQSVERVFIRKPF